MKKLILKTSFSFLVLTSPLVSVISCSRLFDGSSKGRSNLEFYNYENYIDPAAEEGIDNNYIYSTYGDLPEFQNYLTAQRSVGGVSSDYYNINLIQKGLISKLDLTRLFDLSADKSKWESELQAIYTPEMWKALTTFDHILGDADEDGINDHLWEYTIPYFNQNKVIAFNKNALNADFIPENILNDQQELQNWFATNTDLSYEAILAKLVEGGASSITINDYMRDNMMIGSEVISRANNVSYFTTTGLINSEEIGKAQIVAFSDMLKVNFEQTIWTTNGTEALENIVTQADQKYSTDVALIYNGDALAAYYGGYNAGSISKEIRIVIPENATFITDGIVMSSVIANDYEEQERFYRTIKNNLTQGAQTDASYDGFTSNWNKVWKNFDYNYYSPAYANIQTYLTDNASDFYEDQNDQFMLEATHYAAYGQANNPINISSSTLAQPISDDLNLILTNYYNKIK